MRLGSTRAHHETGVRRGRAVVPLQPEPRARGGHHPGAFHYSHVCIYGIHAIVFGRSPNSHPLSFAPDRPAQQLKASEAEARLQGHLYTEEDDIFDAEAGWSSALPLAPGAPKAGTKKQQQKGAAGSTDPGSLLLLDDENGRETMEDLSKPPSSAAAGEGSKLLAVMAAGAEMEVLKVRSMLWCFVST